MSSLLALLQIGTDRWYPITGIDGAAYGYGGTGGGDQLRAFPVALPCDHTIDEAAIRVITAVGGTETRIGLYNDAGGYPGDLIADFGALSTATTGVKSITGLAQVIDCSAGPVWAAIWQSDHMALRGVLASSLLPILGIGADLGTNPGIGWGISQTYTVGSSVLPRRRVDPADHHGCISRVFRAPLRMTG
jgi:hypothetical protein